jgi:putative Holliday junction resolvase
LDVTVCLVLIASIDLGRKRTGIAAAEHGVVFPVAVVAPVSLNDLVDTVARRLAEMEAARVIVGWPLNMDGSAGSQALVAERFADQLRLKTGLPVELFDERLTSYEARQRLTAVPRRRRRGEAIDALAACVILESWLQNRERPER